MKQKSKRGFASMDKKRHREIAAMGGKAVPTGKRSFSLDRKLASKAGQKGGASVPATKRSFYTDRELAREAGSKSKDTQ